jgi:hypothetical protein
LGLAFLYPRSLCPFDRDAHSRDLRSSDTTPPKLVVPRPPGVIRLTSPLSPPPSKAHNAPGDCCEDQHHQGHPECRTRHRASTDITHLSLDVREKRNVDGEHDERHEASEEGDQGCDEGYREVRGEGEK